MKRFLILFFLPFVLFSGEEFLRLSDVKGVMDQIFSQHIEEKKISTDIIRQSLVYYMEQFDPLKIYLLESEVKRWSEFDEQELMSVLSSYKRDEFKAYEDLNGELQKAISRARAIRQEIYDQFITSLSEEGEGAIEGYPKDLGELRKKIVQEIVTYIISQVDRFGENEVFENLPKILSHFERRKGVAEGAYLFTDADGHPFPAPKRENDLVLHILKSLTKSLDRYTTFYDEKEAHDMRARLEKETFGIGLLLEDRLDGVFVADVLPHSPAARAGMIERGDYLIAVGDQNVTEESFEEVVERLHKDRQPSISLTLERRKALERQVYRTVLQKEPISFQENRLGVSHSYFGEGIIGTIKLYSFYEGSGTSSEKDVEEALLNLSKIAPLQGLILDLRNNRGGYLSQAVKVAGLFIKNGIVVVSRYGDGSEKIYRDLDGSISYDGPLIVLVSRETASAAEIVAQALQDYGVALVAGDDRTFGKGTIQSQTVTEPAGPLHFKVTVGTYYTVSGKTPEKRGVISDLIIPGLKMVGEEDQTMKEASIGLENIQSHFKDELQDVAAHEKSWYLKCYMPHLQHPIDKWKKWLPLLRKNSSDRLAASKNYQIFLGKSLVEKGEDEEEDEFLIKRPSNPGVNDLQLEEAIQVVKDMVFLERRYREE